MNRIKCVIWDYDGVIANSHPVSMSFFEHFCKKFGKNYEEFLEKKSFGHTLTQIIEVFNSIEPTDKTLTFNEIKPLLSRNETHYIHMHEAQNSETNVNYWNHDTLDIIRKLQSLGIKNAIASNSEFARIPLCLKTSGIENLFDFIIGYDQVSFPKPNPEMIFETCKWLNIEPNEAIFVDDSLIGIGAGIAAGCTNIWLNNYAETCTIEGVDYEISDIKDFPWHLIKS